MTPSGSSAAGFDQDEFIHAHPVATLILDQDATILFANAAAELLCNLSQSAMVGQAILKLISIDSAYRQRLLDPATPSLFVRHSEIIVGAGRRSIFVDLQMVPFGQYGHRILAMIPSHSEADWMGGAVGRSGRAASAAAVMLAHEIKNPLAGIKGAAQLLARKAEAGDVRFTSLICAEVDRITKLIDQMERFSSGQPLACTPINLYQPLHQAIETVKVRQLPGIGLIEEYDPSLPQVMGNHDAIIQILLNFVTNACEALQGHDDGKIKITTAYRHGLSIDNGDQRGRVSLPIEISVSDNGPGVPMDIRGDVFDPFVTTKREGRGLGLALVAKLARDMGGTVHHMRREGWTHFRLHLPAAVNMIRNGKDQG